VKYIIKIKQTGWNMRKNAKKELSNLQQRNATKYVLLKLFTNDGVPHDSPNDILKEKVEYFKNMFSFQSPPSSLTEGNCTVDVYIYQQIDEKRLWLQHSTFYCPKQLGKQSTGH
jgi:hypothetical protein